MSRSAHPEKKPEKKGFSAGDLRILGVVALVAVVVGAVALWPRGDDGHASDKPATDQSADSAPASAAADRPSDEEWCTDFRALAADQADHVATGGSPDLLIREASDLAELGLPVSMPSLAVGGWWALLDGVFESVGATPPPETFLDDPPDDEGQYESEEAFTTYTNDHCPA